jgi:Rod binding domain-containing protein
MTSLPPIDASLLPADVRNGTQEQKTQYQAALEFERQLVEQLTKSLADTSTSDDAGSDDDSDGTTSSAALDTYKQMLPGVMADSIMQGGGLGLARTIAQNLKATQS